MTLWNSFDSVLAAVQENGWALQSADDSLKRNKQIVLAAVQQDGGALECADDSLKRNEQIVLAAVQQNGYALDYAHETLKDDELFLSIVDSTGMLRIECVSKRIREEIRKDLRIVGCEKLQRV
jgi:hypothetical protein